MDLYFYEHINRLAAQHDLHRDTDGVVSTMYIVLPLGTHVGIRFNEIDPNCRARVFTGTFVPPIDRYGRERFMRHALRFNRNAIAILDAGYVPHIEQTNAFMFNWFVPRFSQSEKTWGEQLTAFEGLANYCRGENAKLVQQWANCLH